MLIQPVITDHPIISFNIAVLLWFTRLDIPQMNAFAFGPALQPGADILRTVVAADLFGTASPFDYLIERPLHAFCGERKIYLDAKDFSVKVIDDVQGPYAAAVLQLIVHKVH